MNVIVWRRRGVSHEYLHCVVTAEFYLEKNSSPHDNLHHSFILYNSELVDTTHVTHCVLYVHHSRLVDTPHNSDSLFLYNKLVNKLVNTQLTYTQLAHFIKKNNHEK